MWFWVKKPFFFTKRSEIVPSFQNVQNYENRTKNAKVRTKLRFLRFSDFRQKSASKKWPKFQIGVLVSGCPKIRKISFLRCFMENPQKKQENTKNFSEKSFGAGKVSKIHFSDTSYFSPLSFNIGSEKQCLKEWRLSRNYIFRKKKRSQLRDSISRNAPNRFFFWKR